MKSPETPRFNTLDQWLRWQESLHWTEIDLGIERVLMVARRLELHSLPCKIITVAGTNGKGSTVAMLDAILQAAGYSTGACTSPFLYRYNERIQLSGEEASDQLICQAFEMIDEARNEISLTYFEFATLAAVWIFKQKNVDVAILEVGMGGRLDAVNAWDADAAVITSIGIDHMAWLGNNRQDIGREKAGIMRKGKPVVVGDLNPPVSIMEHALKVQARLYLAGRDFSWRQHKDDWDLKVGQQMWRGLSRPGLQGQYQINNAATAITTLFALRNSFALTQTAINEGLKNAKLAGRLQLIKRDPEVILDVAHNAHAAEQLALWLRQHPCGGKTYALFSMLNDKDVEQVVEKMHPVIDEWYVSTLNDTRAIPVEELLQRMRSQQQEIVLSGFKSLRKAWETLHKRLKKTDRVIVFGSFLVLSEFKVFF